MGAETFKGMGTGSTADEVFKSLVDCARHDYGHSGYTGTIAEKDGYVLVELPENVTASEAMAFLGMYDKSRDGIPDHLLSAVKHWKEIYNDKWGPALAFNLGGNEFVFMGWASG